MTSIKDIHADSGEDVLVAEPGDHSVHMIEEELERIIRESLDEPESIGEEASEINPIDASVDHLLENAITQSNEIKAFYKEFERTKSKYWYYFSKYERQQRDRLNKSESPVRQTGIDEFEDSEV